MKNEPLKEIDRIDEHFADESDALLFSNVKFSLQTLMEAQERLKTTIREEPKHYFCPFCGFADMHKPKGRVCEILKQKSTNPAGEFYNENEKN